MKNTMLRFFVSLLLGAAVFCMKPAHADEEETPPFSSYAVKNLYKGKRSSVVINTREKRLYRTRLRESVEFPVNFAGEYIVVIWGCGSSCGYGAAVNARTGQVVFLPGTFAGWTQDSPTIEYRPDSRLMVLRGYLNEEGIYGIHFYRLAGGAFRFLKVIPVNHYSGVEDDDAVK